MQDVKLARRLRSWFLTQRAAAHRHFGNAGDVQSTRYALLDLAAAITLNPGNGEAYAMRGTLLWRELDQPEGAIPDLTQALALMPRNSEVLLTRGLAHEAAGDAAAALADLERYLAALPTGPSAESVRRICAVLRDAAPAPGDQPTQKETSA